MSKPSVSQSWTGGLIQYDESFFTVLSRMLNEETVQPRDLQMMGMLVPLGLALCSKAGHPKDPRAALGALLAETVRYTEIC